MAELMTLSDAVAELVQRRRLGRARGLHAPDPVRGRSRAAAPGPARAGADPDDAGPALRPDDRHGRGAPAGLLLRRQPRRRLAAPLPRRDRERLAARRSRSRSTATPGMANRYVAGAADLPFAVLRGYAGTDLVAHTNVALHRVPVHRRAARGRAGAATRTSRSSTRRRPTAQGNVQLWGIPGVQKEAVLAAARSLVTVERIVERLEPRPGGGRDPAAGRSTSWRRRRAARSPPTASTSPSATTTSTGSGTRSAATASAFTRLDGGARASAGCARGERRAEHATRSRPSSPRGALAATQDRVHRRRAPEHRRDPRAHGPQPRARADLRVGHDRRQAVPHPAVDRRRRARARPPTRSCRCPRCSTTGSAPGRDRRRVPRRGAGRPLRQPQLDRDRRLRPSAHAAARAPAARPRSPSSCGEVIVDRAALAGARSSSGSTSSRPSATATARARASGSGLRGARADGGDHRPRRARARSRQTEELTLTQLHEGVDRRAGARGDRLGARGRRRAAQSPSRRASDELEALRELLAAVNEAFIYEAVRTPFGRYGGALAGVRPDDLAAHALRALLDARRRSRPGADRRRRVSATRTAPARTTATSRGWRRCSPGCRPAVPGATVNRLCGSSLEAAIQATRARSRCGDASSSSAGGVESMSRAPWVLLKPERGLPAPATRRCTRRRSAGGWSTRGCPSSGRSRSAQSAEKLAGIYAISREAQDAFALRSHRLAAGGVRTRACSPRW